MAWLSRRVKGKAKGTDTALGPGSWGLDPGPWAYPYPYPGPWTLDPGPRTMDLPLTPYPGPLPLSPLDTYAIMAYI